MTRLQELRERIESRQAEIGVVGLGYVGLPLAVAFADAGFRVLGIDLDGDRVDQVNAGRSYLDDVSESDLERLVGAGKLAATTSMREMARLDCIQVCVPTPLTKTKDPDVSHIVAVLEGVRRTLRSGQLVVLGSTTYPGTTSELFRPMLEESGLRLGEDFALAFSPERIDPGNEQYTLHEIPKVVGGDSELCTELAVCLYRTVFDDVVEVSCSRTAEMVKLLENTFRMINIGLANEIAMICERLGIDVWEVIDAAATKPYGFMRFDPGPGLGGHCIPIDPNYLAWKLRSLNYTARFIELASEVNTSMPGWVLDRIVKILNRDRRAVNGSQILVLGVSYKANVSDTRESPALEILDRLREQGADVRYHDPLVAEIETEHARWKSVELTDEELQSADLVVITAAHRTVDYERVVRLAAHVFDTRNATSGLEGGDRVDKL